MWMIQVQASPFYCSLHQDFTHENLMKRRWYLWSSFVGECRAWIRGEVLGMLVCFDVGGLIELRRNTKRSSTYEWWGIKAKVRASTKGWDCKLLFVLHQSRMVQGGSSPLSIPLHVFVYIGCGIGMLDVGCSMQMLLWIPHIAPLFVIIHDLCFFG